MGVLIIGYIYIGSMSRKKPKTTTAPPIEEPPAVEPRERGRPPRGFDVHAFQLRIPVDLHSALLKALAKSRRTKNAEIQLAIEKHLESLDLWALAESATD